MRSVDMEIWNAKLPNFGTSTKFQVEIISLVPIVALIIVFFVLDVFLWKCHWNMRANLIALGVMHCFFSSSLFKKKYNVYILDSKGRIFRWILCTCAPSIIYFVNVTSPFLSLIRFFPKTILIGHTQQQITSTATIVMQEVLRDTNAVIFMFSIPLN